MNNQINTTSSVMSSDERTWAVVCHLAGIVGYFGGPVLLHIIAPLIVWLLGRNGRPFVDDQGKEAVNFQISLTVYWIIGALITLPLSVIFLLSIVGIPLFVLLLVVAGTLALILAIAGVVLAIVAAYYAGNGELYRYPLIIRFIQ